MANKLWNMRYEMPDGREYEVHHAVSEEPENMIAFHAHDYYECYIYISGSIEMVIEEKLYTPQPYDIFIFPPGVMHRWIAKPPVGRYERAFLYITREALEQMSSPDFPMLSILDSATAQRAYCFRHDVQAVTSVIALADETIRHSDLTSPADRLLTRCRVNMLAAALCRLVDSNAEGSSTIPSRVRMIISYVNEHLTEPLTLDGLAEKFFVSKYYLLHAFKDYADMSVYQYILSKRIIHAQNLMREGSNPGDAARSSGFNDYAGFYRAFVKQCGITPQEFCKGGRSVKKNG